MRLTPGEFKKRHIMAVDISTSAISAVLALRHENTEIIEISKTLRCPLNLFGENFSGSLVQHILQEGILKIFKDAHAVSRHADLITVVLSDPFFSDLTFLKKIYRPHPEAKVSEGEVALLFRDLEKAAKHGGNAALVRVGSEILSSKINGYEVPTAGGYKGKSIEISAVFTFMNQFMMEAIAGAQEKFFPRSHLGYISDSMLMRRTLQKLRALDEPAILFDIDGETTGIYFLSGDSIEHLGISAFGIKTLERRFSPLSRYADDMLEENLKAKTETALKPAILDWWEGLSPYLKNLEERGFPKKCYIAGREQAADIFLPHLSNYLKSFFGFEPDLKMFSLEPLRDYFHPASIISKKQDILLASLLYEHDKK
ncbi:MAG: hypothetical protein G01um101444_472 [Parcubacteria group bacterium Gr01-1014_44]|nr:MAG: hypothetical protein G01um101444_472 [Parcubacteria group bacterium Gr01-1014_44]